MYVPLVMAAISNWQGQRLYLAARYNGAVESMNASFIYRWESCGRAVPFLWKVKEHKSSTPKTTTVTKTWNLLPETTPLIRAAGIPGAPKLASHQSTSEEILLEDELKLKTSPGSFLKQQLEKALALLFWNK